MLRTTHDVIAVPTCVCVDGREISFRLTTSQHCCEQGKIKALQSISLHLCADCQKKVGWRRLSSFRRYAGNDKVNSTHFRPSASIEAAKINSSHDQSGPGHKWNPNLRNEPGAECGEKPPRGKPASNCRKFLFRVIDTPIGIARMGSLIRPQIEGNGERESKQQFNCEILSQ